MVKRGRILFALLLCGVMLALPAAQASFSDVVRGSWYEVAVEEMARSGQLSGYPDGTFRPDAPITAAEFVTLVTRCAGRKGATGQNSHWAAKEMEAALQAGWYDWDEIPPTAETYDKPITRQLAVKVLMRALLPDERGDYSTEAAKITDLAALDGRYYEAVFAAYASGIVRGDASGPFRPKSGMSRAETCVIIQRAMAKTGGGVSQPEPPTQPPEQPVTAIRGGASENGWLQVKGVQLCSEAGEPMVLRGMSTHGIQWYGQFASEQSVRNTADAGANVFRVAMYTAEGGYLSQPEAMKQKAAAAVDAAIANDMYVILDWHILSDVNPMSHVNEAKAFFSEMAERYRNTPNVIYEICNEPNGNVSWGKDVKPYAQQVVAAIRAKSPRAVILIGSGTWSQDIHTAAADPVAGENLMYTLHFYAGTHGASLRTRIDEARQKGIAVFVSEWGTSRADGGGGVYLKESKEWLDFLDERDISWCNWSLCDKRESSAALRPGTSPFKAWTDSDLSESGRVVFSRFKA